MKKLFVPYELALIAKEKGFNEECFGFHETKSTITFFDTEYGSIKEPKEKDGLSINAPLYQQLIDWFRESYHIIIQIDAHYNPRVSNDSAIFSSWITQTKEEYRKTSNNYYDVLNKALEEAFKLI